MHGGEQPAPDDKRPPDEEAFLHALGQRVRRIRAIRGMSRKTLARVTGISERYIAQLESGLGNVSIMLLLRIARATGAPLEDIVADASDEWIELRALLRHATAERAAQARAVLEQGVMRKAPAQDDSAQPVLRVALIGLRGAGKSTLGRLAAAQLGMTFLELNQEIEREQGFSVTEIFKLYGQDGYRRMELAALRRIASSNRSMIVAAGGGVVAEKAALDLLLGSFRTIWIKAKPEEHMRRVRQQGDLRPMANDRAAMQELVTILSSREPLYARAEAVVDTSGEDAPTSLAKLLATISALAHSPQRRAPV